ncbi:MAG: hypothetical protein JWO39_946 [Gemmatimonadetes bacterium]|jgi:hypothetical protein|nr:hypothetical protein [Gemmatimonadota bacterium]
MRRAPALFALLSCALSARVVAQQALAQRVTLPSGVTVARACDQLVSEGVQVASIDDRALPAQGAEYLTALSQVIARRVGLRAGDPPRTAMYGALLLRDGTFAHQIPIMRSDRRELDARIDEALAISPSSPDRSATPAGMPDTLRVLVTVGLHEDGSPFVASHVRCPAVAFPDNPRRAEPAWAAGHPRTVVVHGVVMPAGRVDTATAQVDDPSDERYAEAAMSSIAQMRFVPAEFDGVKVPAPIEIVLPFGAIESEEPAASP